MALTQVSSKGIKNATLLNEDVNASADIAGSKLADNSISLAKLVHGDSNNDGKFLRANNGADPTFETITVPASINNLVEDTSPQLGGDLQSNGNDINFVDGDKAIFGTHGDMQIFHDGNNSRLTNTGTGSIIIKNEVQDGDILIQANDGGVNQNILNFDVSESGLASFHGEINMRGTNRIRFYHNTGNGTFQSFIGQQFINNNFNMVIDNQQNSLFVQSDRITLRDKSGEGGEVYAEFIKDGAVELYQNGGKRLETVAAGVNIVGNLGIGDTSPDYEIDIETASPHIRLEETSTGGSKRLDFGVSAAGQAYIAANQSASSIQFETTGGRRFLINANGTINSQAASSGPNLSTMSNNAIEQPHNQFSNAQTYSWNSVFRNHNAGYGIEIKVNDGSSSREGLHIYSTSASQSKAAILMNGGFISRVDDYAGYSDVKLKENIVDAQSQWNDVKAVKVRNFNFKDNPSQKLLGVVAQELETVCPNLIHNLADKETDKETGEIKETGTITKAAKYSILHMKAFKALQEAMARIEILETKVAALETA